MRTSGRGGLKDGLRSEKVYEVLIGKEPLSGPHIKRLHGELEGKYRCEMGGLRIIYEVNVKKKTVEIKSIGGRGDVYKR